MCICLKESIESANTTIEDEDVKGMDAWTLVMYGYSSWSLPLYLFT